MFLSRLAPTPGTGAFCRISAEKETARNERPFAAMTKSYPELPNWFFEVQEVSMGVYEVAAKSDTKQEAMRFLVVSAKGGDPNMLLETCKKGAAAMVAS
jgi:hypothetical protein